MWLYLIPWAVQTTPKVSFPASWQHSDSVIKRFVVMSNPMYSSRSSDYNIPLDDFTPTFKIDFYQNGIKIPVWTLQSYAAARHNNAVTIRCFVIFFFELLDVTFRPISICTMSWEASQSFNAVLFPCPISWNSMCFLSPSLQSWQFFWYCLYLDSSLRLCLLSYHQLYTYSIQPNPIHPSLFSILSVSRNICATFSDNQ